MQRDAAHPFFRAKHIFEEMVPVFEKHTDVLCCILRKAADQNKTVDLQELFNRFTLDSIMEIAFGIDLSCQLENVPFNASFNRIVPELAMREEVPVWKMFFWRLKQFDEDLAVINEFVWAVIANLKKLPREQLMESKGLLAEFLKIDPPLSDEMLRDITVNFLLAGKKTKRTATCVLICCIFAGRDTTSQLLTWCCYFVSKCPGVEAALCEEAWNVMEKDGETQSSDSLNHLAYHKQVLNETLRIIPPVPLEGREAINDDTLPNGIFIPKGEEALHYPSLLPLILQKGWIVGYMGVVYHRTESLWGKDAHYFDPQRWSVERKADIKPYQFLAFHGGEQKCLGQVMAYTEAKVVLSALVRNFHFDLAASDEDVVVSRGLTVYAKNGVKMKVKHRKDVSVDELKRKGIERYDLTTRDRVFFEFNDK